VGYKKDGQYIQAYLIYLSTAVDVAVVISHWRPAGERVLAACEEREAKPRSMKGAPSMAMGQLLGLVGNQDSSSPRDARRRIPSGGVGGDTPEIHTSCRWVNAIFYTGAPLTILYLYN